ncbi:RNA-guided endonuclease TnpB family protein [Streptomyces sp. MZ04]|uniref:RNA-guided endonuclease InsQ/TnpB family protein n=1 Tax=Streptomyces sp. MZ04 TaxID=2559236 RepID=UPI00107E878D|nr:RNA-guided endonuclease TnpB family protein [Streptomyces sp. MZ04]TGB08714.1 transposase [Streptomyces sp. MZ04]
MSRYRLRPTPDQARRLSEHCADARYVWNLAVEQHAWWTPRRGPAPNYVAQARQLTEARREFGWLRAGSQMVQQQALRDFGQAVSNFFAGTHRRPTWRKAGRHEGFRIVAVRSEHIERLSRNAARVWVPKAGWVRFRLSRPLPDGVKSYRITRDSAGRWHIAFAVVPAPVPAPGNGQVVGVDRGVTVSAALSTGELLHAPDLAASERRRLVRLQRKLSRAQRGSSRRSRVKAQIAVLKARETDRRKDWIEKTSTSLARCFDVIGVEDLNIRGMTRSAKGTVEEPGRNVAAKAGLNRGILASGWGLLVTRLEHKAPGRVVRIDPAYSSHTCSACGITDREARESQARISCRSCGHTGNADVNAAINIKTAAGRAVAAREEPAATRLTHREPQLLLSA